MFTAIGMLEIIYGILICFFGFKLFKVQLGITGFLCGGLIAYLLIILTGQSEIFLTPLWVIVLLIPGILGSVLSFKFYNFTVFLTFGALSYNFFMSFGAMDFFLGKIIVITLSIIIGILGVKLNKKIIIILNAIYGAYLLVGVCGGVFFNNPTILFVIGIVLAICGMSFQFKTVKEE